MKRLILFSILFALFFINLCFCETIVCKNGGTLSGIGGDGRRYSASFRGYGKLETVVNPANRNFYLFTLNDEVWPEIGWSVRIDSWNLTCNSSNIAETIICNNGGTLSGIGGDGRIYSASFRGYGKLEAIISPANRNFYLFTLNGKQWPEIGWAVRIDSWKLTCK